MGLIESAQRAKLSGFPRWCQGRGSGTNSCSSLFFTPTYGIGPACELPECRYRDCFGGLADVTQASPNRARVIPSRRSGRSPYGFRYGYNEASSSQLCVQRSIADRYEGLTVPSDKANQRRLAVI